MNKEMKQKLEQPFPSSVIKKRRGPGGKELSYAPVGVYIARLNLVFEDGWSFVITAREQYDLQVIVEGHLIAAGVTKSGLGGAEIRRSRDGESMSLADAFKSASSDCLKRCCRLWGMGADLYDDESVSPQPRGYPQPSKSIFGATKASNDQHGRISRAQIDKLRELVSELGAEWPSFKAWVKSEHDVAVEYATRQLASELIGDLINKAQARRGNGDASQLGGLQ